MEYLVTWEMEIEADSPEDAARKALEVHRRPDSIATVFKVYDDKGIDHIIDLTALDELETEGKE